MVDRIPHGIARLAVPIAQILLERNNEFDCRVLIQKGSVVPSFFQKLDPIECRSRFLSPKAWLEIPQLLKSIRANPSRCIYFNPGFESFPTLPWNHVQIVHDLNHLYFGGTKEKIYYRTVLRHSLEHALRVGAVSEFSCAELAQWMGWERGRVIRIPNVVEPKPPLEISRATELLARAAKEPSPLTPRTYHLCLANPKSHKNLGMLLRAWSCAKVGSAELVLTVRRDDLPADLRSVPRVRCLGPVDDEVAQALMEQCRAFYFPSLYEGQGLPPIEAAWSGVPVVASSIPPHEEALGGVHAITLLDPRQESAWSDAMERAESGQLSPASRADLERTVGSRFSLQALRNSLEPLCFSVLRSMT